MELKWSPETWKGLLSLQTTVAVTCSALFPNSHYLTRRMGRQRPKRTTSRAWVEAGRAPRETFPNATTRQAASRVQHAPAKTTTNCNRRHDHFPEQVAREVVTMLPTEMNQLSPGHSRSVEIISACSIIIQDCVSIRLDQCKYFASFPF